MAEIVVRAADLAVTADAGAYLVQLNAYARDPMGAGAPLPDGHGERLLRDLSQRPGTHVLLAECGADTVGFATCFLGYSTFQARPLLNVHDIAVLPAWRRRGVGRLLLDAISELAGSLGCCRITLEVRDDNLGARGLYENAGFRPASCALFLEKPL